VTNTFLLPPGGVLIAPPNGYVWRFARRNRDGTILFGAIPKADPEPAPPRGTVWRLIHRDTQRIYIAEWADPFTRDADWWNP
jgi:hypothetical protein